MPTAEEMNRGFDAIKYWAEFKDHDAKPVQNGILIDYEYCTDCHSCELACQMHLNLPAEQWGIKTLEYGPIKDVNGNWEWTYIPMPTDLAMVALTALPRVAFRCACITASPASCTTVRSMSWPKRPLRSQRWFSLR